MLRHPAGFYLAGEFHPFVYVVVLGHPAGSRVAGMDSLFLAAGAGRRFRELILDNRLNLPGSNVRQ